MSDKIVEDVKDYINNVIRPPRKEFGGMPTCPFAGPELDSGRLMIDVVVPDKVPLPDLITKFLKSDNNSALFAQLTDQEFSSHDTGMYERFINVLLKRMGAKEYKCICFNPNDKVTEVDGFNARSQAPYFLINIARREELSKAHKTLRKTQYYDRLNEAYIDFLDIKPKKS